MHFLLGFGRFLMLLYFWLSPYWFARMAGHRPPKSAGWISHSITSAPACSAPMKPRLTACGKRTGVVIKHRVDEEAAGRHQG
jgi:hypothetical protein